MHILVLGTIYGKLDRLAAALRHAEHAKIDAIVVLGNIVDGALRQHTAAAQWAHTMLKAEVHDRAVYNDVVALLGARSVPVFVIPGQHDRAFGELKAAIAAHRGAAPMHLVHRSAAALRPREVVAGFGGLITSTPVTDQQVFGAPAWEARMAFDQLNRSDPLFGAAERHVFLFATPPRGRVIDQHAGERVGLESINLLLRRYRPRLLCCGGPADGRGSETIDGALVVNPGAVSSGSYALVDLDTLAVQFHNVPALMTGNNITPVALETG